MAIDLLRDLINHKNGSSPWNWTTTSMGRIPCVLSLNQRAIWFKGYFRHKYANLKPKIMTKDAKKRLVPLHQLWWNYGRIPSVSVLVTGHLLPFAFLSCRSDFTTGDLNRDSNQHLDGSWIHLNDRTANCRQQLRVISSGKADMPQSCSSPI